eukprot:GHVH01015988.1.p1 GENE.GHVH01015988.1~~GHVH01015988.1.p1  ORF type:complete len:498 (-),score=54.03 GHVH01015988.1:1035-2528(-)
MAPMSEPKDTPETANSVVEDDVLVKEQCLSEEVNESDGAGECGDEPVEDNEGHLEGGGIEASEGEGNEEEGSLEEEPLPRKNDKVLPKRQSTDSQRPKPQTRAAARGERPGDHWPPGFSPSAMIPIIKPGELTRSGPLACGVDYRSNSHPARLFCGGIPPQATERDIFDLFEREIGGVAHVQLVLHSPPTYNPHTYDGGINSSLNTPTRYHRGYAFVVFQTPQLKERCLGYPTYSLFGKEMEVKALSDSPPRQKLPPTRMATHMNTNSAAPCHGPAENGLEVNPECKLFVALKNRPGESFKSQLDEEAMKIHFRAYGEVLKAVIVKDPSTGQSRGYGFIYFKNFQGPRLAIAAGREHILGVETLVEVKPFRYTGEAMNDRHNCASVAGLPAGLAARFAFPMPPMNRFVMGHLMGGSPYGMHPPDMYSSGYHNQGGYGTPYHFSDPYLSAQEAAYRGGAGRGSYLPVSRYSHGPPEHFDQSGDSARGGYLGEDQSYGY